MRESKCNEARIERKNKKVKMIKIKNPHLVNFGSVLCFNMLIMTRLMDELLHAVFASPDARDSLLHLLLSLHQRWFALEFKFINVMN